MDDIKLGKYRHFKGKMYEVTGIAHHSENLEEFVVYRALYESDEFGKNALWIRPKSIFLDKVEKDGKMISRFEYVNK